MPKFNVGDVVTMAEYGKRHMFDLIKDACVVGLGNNPWGISGTVYRYDTHVRAILPYDVKWSNGSHNCYSERDLEFFNLNLENK